VQPGPFRFLSKEFTVKTHAPCRPNIDARVAVAVAVVAACISLALFSAVSLTLFSAAA